MMNITEFQVTESTHNPDELGLSLVESCIYHPYEAKATLKRFAEVYGVNPNTVRNRWYPKVSKMFEGLQAPELKTSEGLTEFGWDVLSQFFNRVQKQGEKFDSFKAEYQAKFEPAIEPAGDLAITPTVKMHRIEMPKLPTFDLPSFTVNDRSLELEAQQNQANQLLNQVNQYSATVDQMLIQQAFKEGQMLGEAIASAKRAGLAQVVQRDATELGKTHLDQFQNS